MVSWLRLLEGALHVGDEGVALGDRLGQVEAGDGADLGDPEPLGEARDPVALLEVPGEVADRVEAPGGGLAREADRLERDGDLGGPAGGARRPRRQPVGVPGDVPGAAVVRPALVLLGAQRVDHEHVGVVVVVEGVEDERHRVVLPDLAVTLGDGPRDRFGVGVAALDPEIDHPLVVEDADDGALGGRRAGDRLELGEGLDGGGGVPGGFVEDAVDFDGVGGPGCRDLLGGDAGTPREEGGWSEEQRRAMAHRPGSIPRGGVQAGRAAARRRALAYLVNRKPKTAMSTVIRRA